ncbi:hypothetical protein STEG23_026629, partial [Scotinomys teguina]
MRSIKSATLVNISNCDDDDYVDDDDDDDDDDDNDDEDGCGGCSAGSMVAMELASFPIVKGCAFPLRVCLIMERMMRDTQYDYGDKGKDEWGKKAKESEEHWTNVTSEEKDKSTRRKWPNK